MHVQVISFGTFTLGVFSLHVGSTATWEERERQRERENGLKSLSYLCLSSVHVRHMSEKNLWNDPISSCHLRQPYEKDPKWEMLTAQSTHRFVNKINDKILRYSYKVVCYLAIIRHMTNSFIKWNNLNFSLYILLKCLLSEILNAIL